MQSNLTKNNWKKSTCLGYHVEVSSQFDLWTHNSWSQQLAPPLCSAKKLYILFVYFPRAPIRLLPSGNTRTGKNSVAHMSGCWLSVYTYAERKAPPVSSAQTQLRSGTARSLAPRCTSSSLKGSADNTDGAQTCSPCRVSNLCSAPFSFYCTWWWARRKHAVKCYLQQPVFVPVFILANTNRT